MPELDRERLMRKTKAELLDEVQSALNENDREHGKRLRLQAESTRRLMAGRTYEDEMAGLHTRVAELERQLQSAQEELKRLRGQPGTSYRTVVSGAL